MGGHTSCMKISPVDPRDIEAEIRRPVYRVYVWTADPYGPVGERCDEYELREAADIEEVLAWAKEEAAGRYIQVYVVNGTEATVLLNTHPTR